MHKFLTSVIGLLTATASGLPLQAANTPKLVIGIHIDQLKGEYLDWFMNGFGDGGFKQMIQSGTFCETMLYNYPKPDAASACASFMTGCNPRQHGIISKQWYDRNTESITSSVYDPKYLGNYTQATVSPKNLLSSTLGDELKSASGGESKVFSVGITAEEAIMLGGHTADGVFWIDENSGKWCTSTYYNYMPWWVQGLNDRRDMSQLVEQTSWQPLLPLSRYQYMPYKKSPTLFQYLLSKYGKDKFRMYKETPMVNAEVCKLAMETINKELLGRDEATDFLVLEMTASSGLEKARPMFALETQDIYFRLDKDISTLIANVDQQIGMENVLIYIVGSGVPTFPAVNISEEKTYGGDFYPERCTSLLNLYLMAIYGNEKWVSAWYDQQIFLNRKLIEEKGINYDDFSLKAAEFLTEFSGVQSVIRFKHFLFGEYNTALNEIANSVYPKHSGDLFLEIQSGWNIRDVANVKDHQVRSEAYSTPFIMYGANVAAQKIVRPVSSMDITTTLSKIFRIRPPNACKGQILPELN
ncbi:MAG: alkaline phosphatase family protein [Bacteroidales bacterium]|nr:alkaline phosphatase family protein [Bacteroidales bacterium]